MSCTVITVTNIIISSCNFWCSEKLETILKIFLVPKNPQVPNFRLLPQCIWSGSPNELNGAGRRGGAMAFL